MLLFFCLNLKNDFYCFVVCVLVIITNIKNIFKELVKIRNANGWGTVYKLSGRRRNPYCVRVTLGWEIKDNKEVQKRKIIGYFKTKKEAQSFLFEYNDKKYNIDYLNYTFEDVYRKMLDNKKDISKSTLNSYKMAFNLLEAIHQRKFSELKLNDYQQVINKANKEFHTNRKIKGLISIMYDFAIKTDIISNPKNLAEWLDIGKNETKEKEIFTDAEVEILKKNDYNDTCKMILILIYSGLRISELLELKLEHTHIQERYLNIVDSKTLAGIRKVPINKRILGYIEYFYEKNKNNEYLVTNNKEQPFKYSNFKTDFFDKTIKNLGLNENVGIHGCRHTFISSLVRNNANQTHIKKIVGHQSFQELYERTYSHSNMQELLETIDLL